jgi:hypothetical protein
MPGARRIAAVAIALAAGAAPALAATFTPKTRVVADPSGDVTKNPMDLTRVSLGRASNGELRGSLTAAAAFSVKSMVAKDGIPGSVCLRLWTKTKAGGTPPDYLVCVTAAKDGKSLDGSVLQERTGSTPVRVGPAHVSRSNARNVTVRFGQSRVGRPAVIHFAGETTAAGCNRITCTDVAPQDGRTAAFRLRRT